ncbi:ThiF family adenylyltransferase [Paraburkholderia youngii]|uniref:ThiF family adenylyltransferase n=1 Tax=Paraburkholderia youngii TaxID=2782701 RepID=UPI003D2349E5
MLIEGLGFCHIAELAYTCFLFESEITPAAPAGAFPATVYGFFDWVKSWNRNLLRSIRSRLASNARYLQQKRCVLAISSPVGRFGVQFEHDPKHRLGFLRDPAAYCHFLHGTKGGKTPVDRLRFDDIGPTYIHSRNLEFESLAGKRIRLVGCGAIGGYLASALVRLGAGTGKGGLLSVYDPGIMEAENLGRHALGFRALFRNKAEAIRDDLMNQFPYVTIEAHGERPTYNDAFFATDLVIDATGNEAHSEKLNFYHVMRRLCPVLYIRVMGNGECVQTVFCDSSRFACFRCLRLGKGGNYREDRFPVLKSAPITRFRGCASFTPFAVSSSLSAAALAADAVIDWLKGAPTPRFRTRRAESGETRFFPNQDLAPIKGCPACQGTS